jgi:GH15 family glucan-1,4-alpha-glucosidase
MAEALPAPLAPAAAALAAPELETPALHDYGLIGNLHTTALVSRFGSIDWACLPRSASPSLFARLLDLHRGGYASARPERFQRAEQAYRASTNVLETRFEIAPDQELRLTDFMPVHPERVDRGDPRILRRLEAREGTVPVWIDIEPRYPYGRAALSWERGNGAWIARGEDGAVRAEVRLPEPAEVDGGALRSRTWLAPGRPVWVEIGWGPPGGSEEPEALLEATATFWRSWVHRAHDRIHRIAKPWHAWIERSELLLKLLSDAGSGAFIAAPTTSLPEWPGGHRNWDYRYVWLRDAAFTAQILALLGHHRESAAYLEWVVDRIDAEGPLGRLRVMYDAHGDRADLSEHELGYLEGFAGSRPVRIGNGAAEQVQLDIYGEVLDAVRIYHESEGAEAFLRRRWAELSRLADKVTELWRTPDQGIWEIRGPGREYVHSKLMCWVALDRAVRLAETLGGDPRIDRWREEGAAIRELLLARGYDRARGAFVQALDHPVLDAAALRVPLVGFLPFDDPRVVGTVAAVRRELAQGPFVRRYVSPDDWAEPEGSFLLCGFWLVECLAQVGERELALQNFEGLLRAASPLGLFSEEYDPERSLPLGNYPQAFTHIGVLRAALALGRTAP